MDENMVRKGGEHQGLRLPFEMLLDAQSQLPLSEILAAEAVRNSREIRFSDFVENVLLRIAFECMMCVDVADRQIAASLAEEPAKNLSALFATVAQTRNSSAIDKCVNFAFRNLENNRMPESVLIALRSGVDAIPIEGIVEFAVKQTILSGGDRSYGGTSQIRRELKRLKVREPSPLQGSIWTYLISQESSELLEAALAQVKAIACVPSSYCEEFCRADLGATQNTMKQHFGVAGAGKTTSSWWTFGRRASRRDT